MGSVLPSNEPGLELERRTNPAPAILRAIVRPLAAGLLAFGIAKGDTILIERYQYGRTDRQRLASFSMAKSIVGLLVGVALDEGAIRSLDDVVADYVRDLDGTVWGPVPIRALLEMRSGVYFREDYADPTSDIHTLARATLEQAPGGGLAALKRFDWRRAPPGR